MLALISKLSFNYTPTYFNSMVSSASNSQYKY